MLVSLSTSGEWKTIGSFGEGLRFHAKNMASLNPLEKLGYAGERLWYRFFRLRLAIANALATHGRGGGGRTSSSKLLLARTFATHIRAGREYRPALFRGKLTYFRASGDADRDPEPFWSRAVKYLGMFSEQNAPALAAELKTCIDQARGESA